jgi:hypothetical protein
MISSRISKNDHSTLTITRKRTIRRNLRLASWIMFNQSIPSCTTDKNHSTFQVTIKLYKICINFIQSIERQNVVSTVVMAC